ncbi:hypothetical protein [Spiroplasma sp. ald]|uniref:hypothetical protein n=1 Tax=Spiroplasma sp. ald TaxID=2490849 RepID=UPI0037DCBB1F
MLSEADAKYVWKNSIFKSNTLSIIPWSDTEKSGIWQIEISPEKITKIVDDYFKNNLVKIDNRSIIYNLNNELSVPFNNISIVNKDDRWSVSDDYALKNEIKKWNKVDTPDFQLNTSNRYMFDYNFKDKIIRIKIKGGEVEKETWGGWLELNLNESGGKYNLPLSINNSNSYFNLKIELIELQTALITLDTNITVNIQDIKIESWE